MFLTRWWRQKDVQPRETLRRVKGWSEIEFNSITEHGWLGINLLSISKHVRWDEYYDKPTPEAHWGLSGGVAKGSVQIPVIIRPGNTVPARLGTSDSNLKFPGYMYLSATLPADEPGMPGLNVALLPPVFREVWRAHRMSATPAWNPPSVNLHPVPHPLWTFEEYVKSMDAGGTPDEWMLPIRMVSTSSTLNLPTYSV